MRGADPQIHRVLESLSTLLQRKLRLVESDDSEGESLVASTPTHGVPRLAIEDVGEGRFTAKERTFLHDMLDLIVSDLQAKGEFSTIDQRLRLMEKENIELSMKNRALADMSSRDVLTGLYTRWYIVDKIEAEMNRALRHGAPLSLLMIDLDHFRQINDTHGHQAGDHVLQAVGHVLRDSCRIYDVPGRYGGEEFCILLPDTKIEKTKPVAERIRESVQKKVVQVGSTAINITASIGIAGLESVPEEALLGASSLLERADRALYMAKERGRNRVELWSPSMSSRPGVVLLEH